MGDYINRDAAIRALEVSNVHRGIISALQENLRDIPAADVMVRPCWVSVRERLPEIMATVIVTGRMKYDWEKGYIRFVDVAQHNGDGDYCFFNDWYEGQDVFEVTHWMPLPDPPVEEVTDHGP